MENSPYAKLIDWLIIFGERASNALLYSSAYLAIIAMAQVAIVMIFLSLPPNPAPLVIGLVTFAVYANDRLVDVDTDVMTNPKQAAFVYRNKNKLYVLAAIAYGIAVALSVIGGLATLSITLMPGVFWVLYATEWIPDIGVHFRRLKELFIVNSVVVALGWAVTIIFLPIGFTGAPITPTVAVLFVYFFLGTFASTEIPNVYDMDGDRSIGVDTMPIVLGVTRTRQILYGVDLLGIGLIAYALSRGYFSVALTAPLVLGLIYSVGVTAFLGRAENGRLVSIAAESEYVFVWLLLTPIVYGM